MSKTELFSKSHFFALLNKEMEGRGKRSNRDQFDSSFFKQEMEKKKHQTAQSI